MKEGYKQTELGLIPVDWSTFKVKDLILNNIIDKPLDGNHGNIHPKAEDFVSEGIPFIMANDIINGKVDLINCSFISYEQASKLQKGFSIKGDILLTHKGSVGNVAKVPNLSSPYIMLTPQVTYYRIKNNKELNSDFLIQYFQCQAFQNLLRILSGGGTRAYIGITNQQNLPIILPPIKEQNAIANCLSVWDEAIEKQQKLIDAKQIRHKALMQKLLSGKKRLPGFTDEWKFVQFKEFYSENKKQLGNDKLEVLSVTKNGIVSQSEYFNKEIASSDTSKYLIVEKDDFVVSGLNFWMGSFDVLTNFEIGVVSPAYKVFRLNKEFNNLYFKFLSKSKLMLDAMVGASIIGASIVRRNFDKEILYEWTFKIPSLEEQKKIGEFLENSSREIEIEKQKVDQLKEQKKALMQKLLTGKVRLPLNT